MFRLAKQPDLRRMRSAKGFRCESAGQSASGPMDPLGAVPGRMGFERRVRQPASPGTRRMGGAAQAVENGGSDGESPTVRHPTRKRVRDYAGPGTEPQRGPGIFLSEPLTCVLCGRTVTQRRFRVPGKDSKMGTTIRTNISVPQELKARMEAVAEPVNWSSVACEAFESKLAEITARRGARDMREAIERLRASRRR